MSSLGSFEELINNNNAELKEFQIEIEKEYKALCLECVELCSSSLSNSLFKLNEYPTNEELFQQINKEINEEKIKEKQYENKNGNRSRSTCRSRKTNDNSIPSHIIKKSSNKSSKESLFTPNSKQERNLQYIDNQNHNTTNNQNNHFSSSKTQTKSSPTSSNVNLNIPPPSNVIPDGKLNLLKNIINSKNLNNQILPSNNISTDTEPPINIPSQLPAYPAIERALKLRTIREKLINNNNNNDNHSEKLINDETKTKITPEIASSDTISNSMPLDNIRQSLEFEIENLKLSSLTPRKNSILHTDNLLSNAPIHNDKSPIIPSSKINQLSSSLSLSSSPASNSNSNSNSNIIQTVLTKSQSENFELTKLINHQKNQSLMKIFIKGTERKIKKEILMDWKELLHVIIAKRQISHSILIRLFQSWKNYSKESIREKRLAAIKIQTSYRSYTCRTSYPKIKLAENHRKKLLLTKIMRRWSNSAKRWSRWSLRFEKKRSTWGIKLIHLHLGHSFPKGMWRSKEGTWVLAEEWFKWRIVRTMWVKWMKYIVEK